MERVKQALERAEQENTQVGAPEEPSKTEDVHATDYDEPEVASSDQDRVACSRGQSPRFTVEYKLRILNEVDQSKSEEEVNDVVARENLTRSLLERWRLERENGDLYRIGSKDRRIERRHYLIRSRDQGIEAGPAASSQSLGFARSVATETSREELLNRIWAGKWTILTIVVLITTATLGVLLWWITPMFLAKGLIVIESGEQSVAGIQPIIRGLSAEQKVETEIEVLRSPNLANKTIERVNLRNNKEFNSALREKGTLDRVSEVIERWLPSHEAVLTEQQRQEIDVVDEFLDHLKVMPEGRSRVVAVTFKSKDPELAARVVNTLMDVYMDEQMNAKFKGVRHANDWLSERISSLKGKVQVAETAVERFRKKFGLLQSGEGTTLRAQGIAELNTQLTLASAARAEAASRLSQVRTLVSQADGFESATEVLQSELIQRLREQEALLEREAAEFSTEYGAKHPRVVNSHAEKKDLQAKIATEVSKIVKGLENEVAVARARETALQSSINRSKRQIAKDNEADVKLRALEREAAAQRTLLETFLGRFNETSIQRDTDIQPPDAHVASLALVPIKPVYPAKTRILLLSLIASVCGGIGLVCGLLNRGFLRGEDVESETGVPVLGSVPKLSRITVFRTPAKRYFREHPLSGFSEAIRTVNTALRIASKPKKLLITSALPKEGKTLFALSLARSQALAGYKVILVSTDVRWPKMEDAFNLPKSPGLCEYLEGNSSVDQIIKKDKVTGVHVVPAGRPETIDISYLFDTRLMDELLDDLTNEYESVVIDSPPVMAVSEALVLANKVDMTVFVVRWATTPKATVRQALRQLAQSTSPIGVVMSMVDDITKHRSIERYYVTNRLRRLEKPLHL